MEIKEINEITFKIISQEYMVKYYDMLYSWFRNYRLEAEFLHKLFSSFDTKINSVLDVGCGTGNHLLALQHYFYSLTGIDISSEMLSLAKLKIAINSNISLIKGNILNPPLDKNHFDAIYSLFSLVYNFYPFNNLLQFFSNVRELLKPDGFFILEVLNNINYKKKYSKPQFYYLGNHKWKKYKISTHVYPYFDKHRLLHMNLFHIINNPKGNELRLKTKHILCMYDIHQLKIAAKKNYLSPVKVYGDFNFKPFDNENSESIIIIFQLKEQKID